MESERARCTVVRDPWSKQSCFAACCDEGRCFGYRRHTLQCLHTKRMRECSRASLSQVRKRAFDQRQTKLVGCFLDAWLSGLGGFRRKTPQTMLRQSVMLERCRNHGTNVGSRRRTPEAKARHDNHCFTTRQ